MSPPGSLRRLAFLVLGCCLFAALVAGAAVGTVSTGADGPVPGVVNAGNTSNYLQPEPGDAVRDGSAVQRVDVGVSVATHADQIEGQHERRTLDRELRAESDEEARLEHVQSRVATLSERVGRLRATNRETRAAYRDGTISERQYFQRVARLDASIDRASATQEFLTARIGALNPEAQSTLNTLQTLEADLVTMDGPVTDQVRHRYEGNATAGSTYVRVTGTDGYVLATTDGGELYREAQEAGDWDRDGTDRFAGDFTAAYERVQSQYPWAFSNSYGSDSPDPLAGTPLYRLAVVHQHGELTVFLDGATEDVFREVQQKRLSSVPNDWQRSTSADGLQLRVAGSHPTGSLEVQVTDAVTGEGVTADVRVDDTDVGETDDEGRLWTVQPSGGFSVNATNGEDSVTLSVPAEAT